MIRFYFKNYESEEMIWSTDVKSEDAPYVLRCIKECDQVVNPKDKLDVWIVEWTEFNIEHNEKVNFVTAYCRPLCA